VTLTQTARNRVLPLSAVTVALVLASVALRFHWIWNAGDAQIDRAIALVKWVAGRQPDPAETGVLQRMSWAISVGVKLLNGERAVHDAVTGVALQSRLAGILCLSLFATFFSGKGKKASSPWLNLSDMALLATCLAYVAASGVLLHQETQSMSEVVALQLTVVALAWEVSHSSPRQSGTRSFFLWTQALSMSLRVSCILLSIVDADTETMQFHDMPMRQVLILGSMVFGVLVVLARLARERQSWLLLLLGIGAGLVMVAIPLSPMQWLPLVSGYGELVLRLLGNFELVVLMFTAFAGGTTSMVTLLVCANLLYSIHRGAIELGVGGLEAAKSGGAL